MTKQVFGSALVRPWALVKWGGNQPNGRRPSTTVAYITDPIRDAGGAIVGYEGGLVEFYRDKADTWARWHFRYQRPRRFAIDDICAWFPCGKPRDLGPSQTMVKAAKKLVPKNENDDEVTS